MGNTIFDFLVFPGFVFTAAVACLVSWIDRKVTARVQWRTGPPLLQPVYDLVKLSGKENLVPRTGERVSFLASPLVAVTAVTLASTQLWRVLIDADATFVGDLIVVVYLLVVPSIALIIAGASSGNPFASLGASREMKLVLAYELPFILVVLVPVIKCDGAIRLGEIINWQSANGMILGSVSGFIAFLVAILCMQAKLALVPFDMAEAETELIGGPLIEYSGIALAVHMLGRWMLLFVVPVFLVVIFMGGIDFESWHTLWGILKYVLLLVIVVLLRNTNPRVRIDQAMRFFWGPVTILAVLSVILAFLNL